MQVRVFKKEPSLSKQKAGGRGNNNEGGIYRKRRLGVGSDWRRSGRCSATIIRIYWLYFDNIRVALVPPNPNELDMAAVISIARAVFGT